MKVAIGSDHGGYVFKKKIMESLKVQGVEVIDLGTDGEESCDYPEYGIRVAEAVRDQKVDYGIVICRSGVGMSIAANKVKRIRAALCLNTAMAERARQHNDANVLAIWADLVTVEEATRIAEKFLKTAFEGGRHQRRIDLISRYEE